MSSILATLKTIRSTPTIRNKILFTMGILLIYRLLVVIPVPFVDIDQLVQQTIDSSGL